MVELSIVLVILGLLVGGVLSGQSLIRAAELRSIVTEHDKYLAAVRTFRDKYFALPGDMTNATQFWGAVAVPASCAVAPSTTSATCDGDGDGQVNFVSTNAGQSYESYRFWQHLANAGLIEGNYNGTAAGTLVASTANAPIGKISATLWGTVYLGIITNTSTQQFNGDYQNTFIFGGPH